MNAPRHAILSALLHAGTLALASLRHAWMRSALLVLALGISLGLPVALATLLDQASSDMRARARIAPLVLGAKGSESDLVFGTMFFAATPPAGLAMRDLARVETERLATAVPMAVGATARKAPVVGTAVDYFALRGLRHRLTACAPCTYARLLLPCSSRRLPALTPAFCCNIYP